MTRENIFDGPEGSTLVEEDQKPSLINPAISTRSELDGAEQSNIIKATLWLDLTNIRTEDLLTQRQFQFIHTKMFEDVWHWAGEFRTRETNIGVNPREIPFKIVDLCRDLQAMLADTTDSKFSKNEIAIRFHHKLVLIHPFVNGNGRHSRLVTDKLLTNIGERKFTWGISTYPERESLRAAYLSALRVADSQFEYMPLLDFAQS